VADGLGRARTKSRLKGVAPPTSAVAPDGTPKTIGRYEVIDLIGRGAMGVVYKARDPLLDRVVAIKTINAPASLGDRVRRAFLDRFEREAKAAARISHPAIVTIFDVGLALESPFLVMEYLPGETLADRLDRERMPMPQAVECARELASALGAAHRERIVHRDVKPANVLFAGDLRWKLADFGIARMPDSDLTQLGTFMGTPGYSPPEAIREGRYTVQADVFAWGALFYEMLTGAIPYEGPDTETTNRKVLAGEPPSVRTHDGKIPEPLAEVTARAMAHDPAKRFADCTQVAEALTDAWRRSLASGAVPVTAFAAAFMPAATVVPSKASRRAGSDRTTANEVAVEDGPIVVASRSPAARASSEDRTIVDFHPKLDDGPRKSVTPTPVRRDPVAAPVVTPENTRLPIWMIVAGAMLFVILLSALLISIRG
jgi:eukaryotic-like serine/threonine-protein kinase